MSRVVPLALWAAETLPLPDPLLRAGVARLVGRTRERLGRVDPQAERDFAAAMAAFPIALHPAAANAQHYEVPAAFFDLVLGPRRKYSCCLYRTDADSLALAEEQALAETVEHAGLAEGQDILELGCGWGSLTLFLAERLPRARITAVSNSRLQRAAIEAALQARGLTNVTVVTADMNGFAPQARFDRIVSVEMFEHMANWRALLARIRGWLRPDGRLFLHVFTHRSASYRFDPADPADWIAQHFFTGGVMPSRTLARSFPDLFAVEADWQWSGEHYRRTADHWLHNLDTRAAAVEAVLRQHYGAEAGLWRRRWRLFFLATAGLFGADGGRAWGVTHYRMAPAP